MVKKLWEESVNFVRIVNETLLLETGGDLINGGLTSDPNDSGGTTKWGISQKAFPRLDISKITKEEAIDIYFFNYWYPIYDQIHSLQIAFKLFDMGVLMGRKTAIKLLQQTLMVKADGEVGLITIGAINAFREAILLNLYENRLKQRINYLVAKRPTYRHFKRGWYNRIEHRINET